MNRCWTKIVSREYSRRYGIVDTTHTLIQSHNKIPKLLKRILGPKSFPESSTSLTESPKLPVHGLKTKIPK